MAYAWIPLIEFNRRKNRELILSLNKLSEYQTISGRFEKVGYLSNTGYTNQKTKTRYPKEPQGEVRFGERVMPLDIVHDDGPLHRFPLWSQCPKLKP